MQQMTRAVEIEANKDGLRMNADKCKVMITQACTGLGNWPGVVRRQRFRPEGGDPGK